MLFFLILAILSLLVLLSILSKTFSHLNRDNWEEPNAWANVIKKENTQNPSSYSSRDHWEEPNAWGTVMKNRKENIESNTCTECPICQESCAPCSTEKIEHKQIDHPTFLYKRLVNFLIKNSKVNKTTK